MARREEQGRDGGKGKGHRLLLRCGRQIAITHERLEQSDALVVGGRVRARARGPAGPQAAKGVPASEDGPLVTRPRAPTQVAFGRV